MAGFGTVWFGTTLQFNVVRHDMARLGVMRYDRVRLDVARSGAVRLLR